MPNESPSIESRKNTHESFSKFYLMKLLSAVSTVLLQYSRLLRAAVEENYTTFTILSYMRPIMDYIVLESQRLVFL